MTMYERQLAAIPFDATHDAIATILDDLERCGQGRWTVVDGDGRPQLALRGATGGCDPSNPAVVTAGRLIATLLAADDRASRLIEQVTRAERESATDALTGLPNGRSWWRSLACEASRCDREQLCAVIAVVDLDDLKALNDTSGHLAGNALLQRVAHALAGALRPTDTVARLGGDEFGVLAVDCEPPVPERLADRLRDALEEVGACASVGVAVYEPGGFIDDAFDRADRNMYEAKRERQSSRR